MAEDSSSNSLSPTEKPVVSSAANDAVQMEGTPLRGGTSTSGDGNATTIIDTEKASSQHDSSQTHEKNLSKSDDAEDEPKKYAYNPGDRRKLNVATREHVWQVWRPKNDPPPPPLDMDDAQDSPYLTANIFNQLFFQWATPIMVLGWKRALEATDLNKLGRERESHQTSVKFLQEWERRIAEAKVYNAQLVAGEIPVGSMRKTRWAIAGALNKVRRKGFRGSLKEREKLWRQPPPPGAWAPPLPKKGKSQAAPQVAKPANYSGFQRPSLIKSLHPQVSWLLWTGVFVKILGDTSQVTSPLVLKKIIDFGTERYYAARDPALTSPPIGQGIGWAFLLFFMQLLASIFQHQFFFREMSVGVYSRSVLIAALFRRASRMTPKDRSPGKLLNSASTDVSRIDFAAAWSPLIFTTPIQLILCLILLLLQIGPSALAGFALLFISMPMQAQMMKLMFRSRTKSMVFTDQRSRLVNELLGAMRIVKSFSYESNFIKRLKAIRRKELQGIRKILVLRSFSQAFSFSLPALSAVVSFIIYHSAGNQLQAASIFTALTLFQLLRLPLMFLPMALSSGTDAYNASLRLRAVFENEQIEDTSEHDPSSAQALQIEDATFQWYETVQPISTKESKGKQDGSSNKKGRKSKRAKANIDTRQQIQAEQSAGVAGDQSEATATTAQLEPRPTEVAQIEKTLPFALKDLTFELPRGQLCAIVGPVGCGKSSLLSACLGEMPRLDGSGRVIWGSRSIGYVPQQAWIQAASLRDNILFGQPFEEERYWRCIKLAELEGDLATLPQGDFTGIGERGITLSGGQKQRVSIARALYFDPDIYLFDDILSALDAHVGKAVFQNAILGLRARGKTVVLVTHALHHLHAVDRIITMEDGRIAESGTYEHLVSQQGPFARLVDEFGGKEEEEEEKDIEDEEEAIEKAKHDDSGEKKQRKEAGSGIMTQENRNTGSVALQVYKNYIKAGKGYIMLPLVIIAMTLSQGATVMNAYWLTFWEDGTFSNGDINAKSGLYEGVYAGLGIAQAILFFIMGYVTSMLSFWACQNMHHEAIYGIMYAKMSFFDTTPVGRIMNVLMKDIDVADNQLADSFRMALNTIGTVLGSVILITVLTHYFVCVVAVVLIAYYFGAIFYRSSARELKRLDAILRSSLYAHFSESLNGLVVIRAYGEVSAFINENMRRNDHENRAYFMTIVNQRWLGIRLDFLGALLTLVVAILVVSSTTLAPGQVGVALSYVLSTAQSFSWMTRQVAEVENNMNSVERINFYASDLEQEAAQDVPNKVAPSWPEKGQIEISNVALRYRTGLPQVLRNVSLSVEAGSKVGIVGRTGAGKSSLLTGLLRLVELDQGSVTIDGVDVSKIGLSDLRRRIAVLPQDPLIFSGTLRSNLDPFDEYDDVRLYDALKRAYLVQDETPVSAEQTPDEKAGEPKAAQRFSLDTVIEEEGANLSLGQRSLVSLARALVKNSQILLLDEATASVDVKTDAQIQTTIRNEFKGRTLLCIAHRLRTIISYDRIAVFDAGEVVEYDEPLTLYDRPGGVFRDMCLKASITREEMLRARAENAA